MSALQQALITGKSAGDPNNILLYHFEGVNNQQSGVDSAIGGSHPPTFNGTATLSTSASKFGVTSLFPNTTVGNRVTTPHAADLYFGTGDFTIDFWYYRAGTQAAGLVGKRASTAVFAPWNIRDFGSGAIQLSWSSTGTSWDQSGVAIGTAPLSTFCHIAVTRAGGNMRGFLNGVLGLGPVGMGAFWNNVDVLSIGGLSDQACAYGFIDELRINKTAIWTANFTPPTVPYN